jgi:hypothetical protein
MFRWNSLQIERLADGLDPDLSLIGDTCMRALNQTRKSHTGAFEHRTQSLSMSRFTINTLRVSGWLAHQFAS